MSGYVLIFTLFVCFGLNNSSRFEPTWESLDTHVRPAWYDDAKIGIFMHWGVYAVPGLGEWFWEYWKHDHDPTLEKFMKDNYPPGFSYADFAPQLKAEFFNASELADLVAESGAKYYVLTSKHHEGFTLWRSNVSWNWNAVDTGPHRDIVAEVAEAIRSRTSVHFGLYHSLLEWFNPLYLLDQDNHGKTQEYVKKILMPQLIDMVETYHPEYIWADGDWTGAPEYWMSQEFLAWLYNDSPVRDNIMVNDRWGIGTACKHGDVKNCQDKYSPGKKLTFKWENAMSLDKVSWGYRRNIKLDEVYGITELIHLLVKTISTGGNLLVNVGPSPDGTIIPLFQERLKQMGAWLKVNGDAIYSTQTWRVQNDTEVGNVWYTKKSETVYALILTWPSNNLITLHEVIPTKSTTVSMNGVASKLSWYGKPGMPGLQVNIPLLPRPCEWAWSLVLENVQ